MLTGKNNLNAETAKIDFKELLATAEHALDLARREIERDLNNFQSACFKDNSIEMKNVSCDLAQHANMLKRASETLFMLRESQNRTELILVDRFT
jgi:hypothetical protein